MSFIVFLERYSSLNLLDRINNNQTASPGEPGAYGTFFFGINAPQEVICYVRDARLTARIISLTHIQNITVFISGNYSSPAVTATHIHQAVYGRAGPPRIAFPYAFHHSHVSSILNADSVVRETPIDEFGRGVSVGCLTGPFTTGVLASGNTP